MSLSWSSILKGLAVVAIAGLVVFGVVHWYDGQIDQARADGALVERKVWQDKEAARTEAEKQQLAKQAADQSRKAAENTANTLKAESDHAKALQALQGKYDDLAAQYRASGGMRVSRSICDAAGLGGADVPAGNQAGAPGGFTQALAGTVALPEQTQRDLLALAREADQLVEDFRSVKQWAVAQGMIPSMDSPIPPPRAAPPAAAN